MKSREDLSEPRAPMYAVSTQKVKDLGLDVEPLETVLKDAVECFISLGRLKEPKSDQDHIMGNVDAPSVEVM